MTSRKNAFIFYSFYITREKQTWQLRFNEDKPQGNACRSLNQPPSTCGLSLSIELWCEKAIQASIFVRPSDIIALFLSYIRNLRNPSLSDRHSRDVFSHISNHPDPTSAFCNIIFSVIYMLYAFQLLLSLKVFNRHDFYNLLKFCFCCSVVPVHEV